MTERKRILVVDDDRDCVAFAEAVLRRAGYEVISATDGCQGLEKAKAERPDLIILDVLMPERDGWDTCDDLREAEETRRVPIVYLTCVAGPKTIYGSHGAFETEWNEYLTKPVSPKHLVSVVQKLLEKTAVPG